MLDLIRSLGACGAPVGARVRASGAVPALAQALGAARTNAELLPYLRDIVLVPFEMAVIPPIMPFEELEMAARSQPSTASSTPGLLPDDERPPPEPAAAAPPVYQDHFRHATAGELAELLKTPAGVQDLLRYSQLVCNGDAIYENILQGLLDLLSTPLLDVRSPVLADILVHTLASANLELRARSLACIALILARLYADAQLANTHLGDYALAVAYLPLNPNRNAANILLVGEILNLVAPHDQHLKLHFTQIYFDFLFKAHYTTEKRQIAVTAPRLIQMWLCDEHRKLGYISKFAEQYQDALDENDLALTPVERMVCRIPEIYCAKTLVPDEWTYGLEILLVILLHLFVRHIVCGHYGGLWRCLTDDSFLATHTCVGALLANAASRLRADSFLRGETTSGSGPPSSTITKPEQRKICDSCGFEFPKLFYPCDGDDDTSPYARLFDLRKLFHSEYHSSVLEMLLDFFGVVEVAGGGVTSDTDTLLSEDSARRMSHRSANHDHVADYELIISQWVWTYFKRLANIEGVFRTAMVNYVPLIGDLILNYSNKETSMAFVADDIYATDVTDTTCREAMLDRLILNTYCLCNNRNLERQRVIELSIEQIKTSLRYDNVESKLKGGSNCIQLVCLLSLSHDLIGRALLALLNICFEDKNWHVVVSTLGTLRLLNRKFNRVTSDVTPPKQPHVLPFNLTECIQASLDLFFDKLYEQVLLPVMVVGLTSCLTAENVFQPSPDMQAVIIPWWRVRAAALHIIPHLPRIDLLSKYRLPPASPATSDAKASDVPQSINQTVYECMLSRVNDPVAVVRKCAPDCLVQLFINLAGIGCGALADELMATAVEYKVGPKLPQRERALKTATAILNAGLGGSIASCLRQNLAKAVSDPNKPISDAAARLLNMVPRDDGVNAR